MAGGDHDTAVKLQCGRIKIYLLGAAKPQVCHLDAGLHEARGQGVCDVSAAQAHVPAQGHSPGCQVRGIGPADAVGQPFIQFLGDPSPHIVGLKAGQMVHVHLQKGETF